MKLSLITIAIFTATVAIAAPTNSTVPNSMGGVAATASISVDNPSVPKSVANQNHNSLLMVALTSAVTITYTLL